MPAESPSALYQLIWQTRRLFQRLRTASDEMLEGTGINSSQRAILEFLHSGDPKTVSQVAREKSVSRQHIQKLANSLVDLELVKCVENPGHKRSPLLKLTHKGSQLFQSIRKEESAFIQKMEKQFAAKDITKTLNTLIAFNDYLASGDWKRKE